MLLLVFLMCYSISPWGWEDPDNIPTLAKAGFYYNDRNPLIHDMVSRWTLNLPDYSNVVTPYWMTGDARTGMSYTFGYVADPPHFHRVWLPTVDEEFVALDIAFPPNVGHDWQKPLYLVLHGLNGGSREGYVIDFCHERNKEGSTCIVLIARGLGDTPIQGWTVRVL
jgi:predicted alpha/beta-fold hydrolase